MHNKGQFLLAWVSGLCDFVGLSDVDSNRFIVICDEPFKGLGGFSCRQLVTNHVKSI